MEDSMDKKIVIALDQSPHSRNAVRYAAAMAPSLPGIRFCLLHVQPPVSQYLVEEAQRNPTAKAKLNRWLEKNGRAALEMLDAYKEQMVLLGISADVIETKVRMPTHGVAKLIVADARSLPYDAVVMGRRGVSGIQEIFTGRQLLWLGAFR